MSMQSPGECGPTTPRTSAAGELAPSASDRGLQIPAAIGRIRGLVVPALRAAVDALDDERVRLVAAYQLGWCDAAGAPTTGGLGGKAIRPALAVLSAEAGGGSVGDGIPAAVAVELVHNFSLLHDDIMDRDVERRHRPTGWAAFGEGPAILAGNAMLIAAIDVLVATGEAGRRTLPCLLGATQQLIAGQSRDLALERRRDSGAPEVALDEVLAMEAGKTASLMSCSASIGALAAGAPAGVVTALARYGHELGMAFQLVDDILGVTGDPEVTGKSSSSDVRAGKRSAPIVAALQGDSDASRRLAVMLADGPPGADEDVILATKLIEEAGGLAWAAGEANARLATALAALDELPLPPRVASDLIELAEHMVARDH